MLAHVDSLIGDTKCVFFCDTLAQYSWEAEEGWVEVEDDHMILLNPTDITIHLTGELYSENCKQLRRYRLMRTRSQAWLWGMC